MSLYVRYIYIVWCIIVRLTRRPSHTLIPPLNNPSHTHTHTHTQKQSNTDSAEFECKNCGAELTLQQNTLRCVHLWIEYGSGWMDEGWRDGLVPGGPHHARPIHIYSLTPVPITPQHKHPSNTHSPPTPTYYTPIKPRQKKTNSCVSLPAELDADGKPIKKKKKPVKVPGMKGGDDDDE